MKTIESGINKQVKYKYDISVVIPCLNEEKTLAICIEKALNAFKTHNLNGQIIISDNGSTDNSVEIAQSFNSDSVYIVHCKEKGYGNALRLGFKSAQAKYIIMGDADNTYDFSVLNEFYKIAVEDENIQMVIGSRFKGNIEKDAMPFLHQYLGNPALTFIVNVLFGSNLSDTQCGLRLFKKSAYDNINISGTEMEFATEIIIEFIFHNYKIVEIPTNLYKGIAGRIPHLRTFRDGLKILLFILKKKFLRKNFS